MHLLWPLKVGPHTLDGRNQAVKADFVQKGTQLVGTGVVLEVVHQGTATQRQMREKQNRDHQHNAPGTIVDEVSKVVLKGVVRSLMLDHPLAGGKECDQEEDYPNHEIGRAHV